MSHVLLPKRDEEGGVVEWCVGFYTPVLPMTGTNGVYSVGGDFVTIARYPEGEYEAASSEVSFLNGSPHNCYVKSIDAALEKGLPDALSQLGNTLYSALQDISDPTGELEEIRIQLKRIADTMPNT